MTHLLSSPAARGLPIFQRKHGIVLKGSHYLTRNVGSAGALKKWTLLFGLRRTKIAVSSTQYPTVVNAGGSAGFGFYFTAAAAHLNKPTIYNNGTDYRAAEIDLEFAATEHHCIQWDSANATAADRLKYFRNARQTGFDALGLNVDSIWNAANTHYIGTFNQVAGYWLEGLLEYVIFVDNTLVAPTAVLRYSAQTNGYIPRAYSGPVGAGNSFYLDFSNDASLTTLGHDKWNGNHWTLSGWANVADAITSDLGTLGPTKSTYPRLDPLSSAGTVSNAGQSVSSANLTRVTAPLPNSGVWQAEWKGGGSTEMPGVCTNRVDAANYLGNNAYGWSYHGNGTKYNNASAPAYGAAWGAADFIGIVVDSNAHTLTFCKNGVSQGVAFSGLPEDLSFAIGQATAGGVMNCGQAPFQYPIAGAKPLNAYNAPSPAVKRPTNVTAIPTWTGNNGTTNVPLPWDATTEPTLVIARNYTQTYYAQVYDTVRGAGNVLYAGLNNAQASLAGLTAFTSTGFTVGSHGSLNAGANQSIALALRMRPEYGCQMVAVPAGTFTGAAPVAVAAHSGGPNGNRAPDMIWAKSLGIGSWVCWVKGMANNEYISLNQNIGITTSANVWGAHSASQIIASPSFIFGDNVAGIIYLFWNVPGLQHIGYGRGTGGTAPARRVLTDFDPMFWLCKCVSTTSAWMLLDRARSSRRQWGNYLQLNVDSPQFGNDTSFPNYPVATGMAVGTTDANWNASGAFYLDWLRADLHWKYA
ncbi:SPRY domain-containing protein [Ferrovibrio terrae]|uniref:DUF7483 domain-containing protein n=1 Tax=Ferrovibrio terrae TaxID=2594003 RepID=UPI0031381128